MATPMKINEVSKKYGITKRSLRYYEEIGLLKSIRKGDSQSRYYDENAVNRLEQILLLRSVKFSIQEISSVLLSDNTDAAFEIFINRQQEIEERIKELGYIRAVIGSFIKMGRSIGICNVNIYQLLKDQIYMHGHDERMRNMEKSYEGDIVRLEFGLGVLPFIKPNESTDFLDRIREVRNRLELETGKEIPLIRVRDNEGLEELQYRISVKGRILEDHYLEAVPDGDKPAEMVRALENIIRANIEDISIVK